MLLRAALVPDTSLLMPGVSGREAPSDEHVGLLAACRRAVRDLLADRPGRVVVVAPGRTDREIEAAAPGRLVPSAGAVGVPDRPALTPGDRVVQGVGAAVGLHLLVGAGRTDGVAVVEVAADAPAESLVSRGTDLVRRGPVALLLVGALSARRSATSPLPAAADAAAADDAVLADLLRLDAPARARLAAASPEEARRLAVSARPVWQVLLGAAEGVDLVGARLWGGDPLGTSWPVLAWTPR